MPSRHDVQRPFRHCSEAQSESVCRLDRPRIPDRFRPRNRCLFLDHSSCHLRRWPACIAVPHPSAGSKLMQSVCSMHRLPLTQGCNRSSTIKVVSFALVRPSKHPGARHRCLDKSRRHIVDRVHIGHRQDSGCNSDRHLRHRWLRHPRDSQQIVSVPLC